MSSDSQGSKEANDCTTEYSAGQNRSISGVEVSGGYPTGSQLRGVSCVIFLFVGLTILEKKKPVAA